MDQLQEELETIAKGDYEGIQTMHFWFEQSGRKRGQTTATDDNGTRGDTREKEPGMLLP